MKLKLFKKPFITSGVFIAIGMAMLFCGVALAGADSNYYALAVFGGLFVVSGCITMWIYGALQNKFNKLIAGNVLLDFEYSKEHFQKSAGRNVQELKVHNRSLLLVILLFCLITALLGSFLVKDAHIIILISVAMAAFLTLCYFLITSYRAAKLRNGSHRIILGREGAYAFGQFHYWNKPAAKLIYVKYNDTEDSDENNIEIEYMAYTLPSPAVYKVVIPVPEALAQQAENAAGILSQQQSQID